METILDLRHGVLRIRGWPSDLRPPIGLRSVGTELRGPPRLRWRARITLHNAGVPLLDHVLHPTTSVMEWPEPTRCEPVLLTTWLAHQGRGIAVGFREVERLDLVVAAVARLRVQALVVVRDSGAALVWQDGLRGRCSPESIPVTTVADAARTMSWRFRRHDLLVVDRPEQMPGSILDAVFSGSAACHLLSFVDDVGNRRLFDLTAWSGAVLGIADPFLGPRRLELRLPLTPVERSDYDEAWDTFFSAYDRHLSLRPGTGFGTFVQQARADVYQRGALLAWHRAQKIAAWNEAKAKAVAALLLRHHGERILVFTPDRASAYELSRAHLIAAVTAELPVRERRDMLADFAALKLRVLAGPRLLDLGVPEGAATVGILVGGGFGSAQRIARSRRVTAEGLIYELVTQDTGDVGRVQRFARSDAAAAVVHPPDLR